MTTKRYRASATLEAYILAHAPAHFATPDAPDTLEKLKAAWERREETGGLPVYDGGCDRTIYSSPAINHAMRAWHDAMHVAGDCTFDARGEQAVAWTAWQEMTDAGLPFEDVFAMHADLWGQFLYANNHDGQFPDDQAAFVAACFDLSIGRASGFSRKY